MLSYVRVLRKGKATFASRFCCCVLSCDVFVLGWWFRFDVLCWFPCFCCSCAEVSPMFFLCGVLVHRCFHFCYSNITYLQETSSINDLFQKRVQKTLQGTFSLHVFTREPFIQKSLQETFCTVYRHMFLKKNCSERVFRRKLKLKEFVPKGSST